MAKSEKKMLSELLEENFLSIYDVDDYVEQIILFLQEYVKKYPQYKLRLEEYEFEDYGRYTTRFNLIGERLETDEEFEKRLKEEKQIKAQKRNELKKQKQKEYQQYFLLKKKFEGN